MAALVAGLVVVIAYFFHDFHFLLVDRVVEYTPDVSAVAIKNVTINDNFFSCDFPDRLIMPGVLMVELGYTFLPYVHAGLSTAPQYLVHDSKSLGTHSIVARDVDSVILPIDACGGEEALAFASRKTNGVSQEKRRKSACLLVGPY